MTRRLRADLRGIYIIWYRDVLRFWRDRSRMVAALGQPLLFLFVFGSGLSASMGRTGGASFGGAGDYISFLFPGVVAMAVLFTAVFSAMSIVWDREFGFLKEVLVAPVSRSAVAVGKALGGSTQAVLQGSIVMLMAPLAGVPLDPLLLAQMVPLMFLLAFAMTSLGIAVASRLKSMEGFQMVMNFLLMPMLFLSGALFPLQGLPGWLTVLTRLDPASYGVDPLRRVVLMSVAPQSSALSTVGVDLLGRPLGIMEEVAITFAFALVMLALAVRSFARQE